MDLNEFFGRPADYSQEFTNRVAGLAEELSTVLGVTVGHERDMNYRAGQLLTVHLGPDGTATGDAAQAWGAVKTAISSKGPLYALLAFRKKPGTNEWFPVGVSAAAREVAAGGALAAIVGVMRAAGLEQVPESTLDDPVPDHLTEMDDLPATVRDVLFCEVC
jgi:hypothetical protein